MKRFGDFYGTLTFGAPIPALGTSVLFRGRSVTVLKQGKEIEEKPVFEPCERLGINRVVVNCAGNVDGNGVNEQQSKAE